MCLRNKLHICHVILPKGKEVRQVIIIIDPVAMLLLCGLPTVHYRLLIVKLFLVIFTKEVTYVKEDTSNPHDLYKTCI